MTELSSDYMLDSDIECDRLERQALLHGPERVRRHFQVEPGYRILDAGCGSGWVARRLAAWFPEAEVVGIDFNPRYIDYARRLADAEGLKNLSFRVGDLRTLPFEAGAFDTVWSQYVLHFVPDPQAAVAEFRRVARPGGRVMAAVHERPLASLYPEDPKLQPLIDKLVDNAMSAWQSRRLPMLFRSAGLVEVEIEVELDRVYSKIGRIDPDRRRNVTEVLTALLERFAHLFDSADQASVFREEFLAYLDRDDTCVLATYWVAKGQVPPPR